MADIETAQWFILIDSHAYYHAQRKWRTIWYLLYNLWPAGPSFREISLPKQNDYKVGKKAVGVRVTSNFLPTEVTCGKLAGSSGKHFSSSFPHHPLFRISASVPSSLFVSIHWTLLQANCWSGTTFSFLPAFQLALLWNHSTLADQWNCLSLC